MERQKKTKTDESLMRVPRSKVLITPSAKSPRPWCWALRGVLPPQEGLAQPTLPYRHRIPQNAVDSQQEADTGNKPGDSLTVKEGGAAFHLLSQPLEEDGLLHSSGKQGMMNESKRKGQAPKEV